MIDFGQIAYGDALVASGPSAFASIMGNWPKTRKQG